jgi:hypothetical protein
MPIADKSVTGAASKILGLLNPEPETPKESTQDQGQTELESKVEPSTEPVVSLEKEIKWKNENKVLVKRHQSRPKELDELDEA